MKSLQLFFASLISALFLISCEKEELPQFDNSGDYSDGFFVVNEGTQTTGSISYVKSDFSSVKNDIFTTENASASGIGGYVQSVFFHDEKAFIISGSNLVTVVNRNTFKLIGRINTGLVNPRYGVVANGKAYITNSNTFSFDNAATGNTDDFLAVVNLETLQVESTINMNSIADKILLINGKLYVSGGLYGEGNSLNIINPQTNTIETTLTFGNSPNSMEAYNGKLYVLSSNYTAESQLTKIDLSTDTIENTITLPATLGNAQNLNVENNQIYFTVGKKVFASSIASSTISDVPVFESGAQNLYGFVVKNSAIYITDSKDYISNGQVLVYSTSGVLAYQIGVGLIPNGVYFN